jgi:hypothetical protein
MYEFLVVKKVLEKKEIVLNRLNEKMFDFGKRRERVIGSA